jgi:hypothetical protein
MKNFLFLLFLSFASCTAPAPEFVFEDDIDQFSTPLRNLASDAGLLESKRVFKGDYLVYQDLNGNHLELKGKKIYTRSLSAIQLISIDRGPMRAGSDRYVAVQANVAGARQKVWVHHSGTVQGIQQVLSTLGKTERDSLPWGDSLITEAYLKNLHLRKPWFDEVKDFFDPDSELGKQIIAGIASPKNLAKQEQYFYVVDHENPVPILTPSGTYTGKNLEPGTVVIVNMQRKFTFDPNSQRYKQTGDFISPLVQFITVANFFGDQPVKGYMHVSGLSDAIRPLEDLNELTKNYDLYIPVLRASFAAEDANLTIETALKQFHNSICTAPGNGKAALLAKWKKFIESKTDARSRQIAMNAQHVDITARTIMGEVQREKNLFNQSSIQQLKSEVFHPNAVSCQIDIVALSIRNRAFASKNYRSLYGFSYPGDFTGVATRDTQFNLWFPEIVERGNYRLTSCFHSDHAEYLAARKKKDSSYPAVRAFYEHAVIRVPKVFGFSGNDAREAKDDPTYLSNLFHADPQITLSSAERRKNLISYTHYYHPNNNGLPSGDAGMALDNHAGGAVKNGFVRIIYLGAPGATTVAYFPVTNGMLTRFDKEKIPHKFQVRLRGLANDFGPFLVSSSNKPAYNFEIKVNGKWLNPNVYFRRASDGLILAHLMEHQLEGESGSANERQALLPNGLLPQCFAADGYISNEALKRGVKVPFFWFSKAIRNEAADTIDRLLAGKNEAMSDFMGGSYYRVDIPDKKRRGYFSDTGTPVKISCIDPTYHAPSRSNTNSGFPEFGGFCDPNIMLMRGM